jgi:2-hydroxychromene-2-carboxylate isomerase
MLHIATEQPLNNRINFMTTVKYYFDYGSPYSYLASTQLPKQDFKVEYLPITATDVMALVNNQPTAKCLAKLACTVLDTTRLAQHYSVPFKLNQQWWSALQSNAINMRPYSCGALAAQQLGHFQAYHRAMLDAIWGHPRDVVSEEGRRALLQDMGVPAKEVWDLARTPEFESKLDQRNAEAATAGVFGVPIFVVDEEMYFGSDRLDLVIQHAAASSRSKVFA